MKHLTVILTLIFFLICSTSIGQDFIKKHKQLSIQGGIFDSEFIEAEKVKTLARLPSIQELRAQIVGTIKAPINNFVYVLKENIRGLVYILSSLTQQR